MDETIIKFVENWHGWSYALLFLAMFIDANLTILASVFLISVGALNSYLLMGIMIFGAYVEQMWWFAIGRYLGKKELVAEWAARLVGHYDRHLLNSSFRSLVFTKFVFGLHRAVLVRYGMMNHEFSKFFKASAKSTAVWLVIIISLGFGFSESYKILSEYINYAGYFLLVCLILFFAAQYFVSRRLKKDL